MCEITVTNLHDPKLNERLWLLMGTLGSNEKHDDGWGVANQDGKMFKCGVPMHWTTNAGTKIAPVSKGASMLLGHIRDASARVPVNDKNAHPFQLSDITFVHNGKLTPKVEANFVMDEEVPDIDDKTNKQKVDNKTGELLYKKVGRSDSLIFFEEFIKDWEAETEEYPYQDDKFVAVVNKTMSKFYGKFALVFIINGTFYICRGKSADLYISYRLKENKNNSEVLGWAINTSRKTLDTATVLLSNLQSLDGESPLHFTFPELLKEETIYIAEDLGVCEIGVMKEGVQVYTKPVYPNSQVGGATSNKPANFTGTGATNGKITSESEDELVKISRLIYKWMEDYAFSPQDIQILIFLAFQMSTLDVTVDTLKLFYRKVLVKLSNKTDKKTRKAIRRSITGFVGLYNYKELEYPWMLNPKNVQKTFSK